jgi:hypothetical protein
MSAKEYADDLSATVRHALETTRAVAVCPFHSEVIIRVGDDAAESHAVERAPRGPLGAMARIGKRKTSGKKSHGSSAERRTESVHAAQNIDPRRAAHQMHPLNREVQTVIPIVRLSAQFQN